MKIRIPRRVLEHLSGSNAAQDKTDPDHAFMSRVLATPTRKDGSALVELTDAERADLADTWVEAMATGAEQNMHDGPESLADLNAARAALRQLTAEVSHG